MNCPHIQTGKGLHRKKRFLFGLLIVFILYALPMAALASAGAYFYLLVAFAAFVFSIYIVYHVTMRNVKPQYPLVNPEGHPDIYSGRMPRPIYEDMEQYPWFFKKKRAKRHENKRIKKKN
jgi:hypothetical protein